MSAVATYNFGCIESAGTSFRAAHGTWQLVGRRLVVIDCGKRAAGVPIETRKVLLGHRNGDITTHNSAPELEELVEAANRVCGAKSGKTPALVVLEQKSGNRLIVVPKSGAPGEIVPAIHGRHPYGRLYRPSGPPCGRPNSLPANSSNSGRFAPETYLAPNSPSIKNPAKAGILNRAVIARYPDCAEMTHLKDGKVPMRAY